MYFFALSQELLFYWIFSNQIELIMLALRSAGWKYWRREEKDRKFKMGGREGYQKGLRMPVRKWGGEVSIKTSYRLAFVYALREQSQ